MSKIRKVGNGIEPGPIEAGNWPDKLKAHVVTPGHQPRIHGYDVEQDLSRHYSFLEISYLALTGNLGTREQIRILEIALCYLAPVPVAEAPAHVAALTRLSGNSATSALAVGALTLAEQARDQIESQREILAWLDDPHGPPPSGFEPRQDEERSAVERLREIIRRSEIQLPVLDHDLGRSAALTAMLFHAGLQQPEQLETFLVLSRLPCVTAEALAVKPGSFNAYPMRLPDFVYEEQP